MKIRFKHAMLFGALLAGLLLAPLRITGQTLGRDAQSIADNDAFENSSADLTVILTGRTSTTVRLMVMPMTSSGAQYQAALKEALNCTDGEWTTRGGGRFGTVSGDCELRTGKRLLHADSRIDLTPFEQLLARDGTTSLRISVELPKSPETTCSPAPARGDTEGMNVTCEYRISPGTRQSDVISLSYGIPRRTAIGTCSVLVFVLILPIFFAFWLRRQAIRAPEEAKASISFSFLKYRMWGMAGGVLLWWSAVDLLDVNQFSWFLLPESGVLTHLAYSYFLGWFFIWIPPCVIFAICSVILHPVAVLRGSQRTQSDTLWQSISTIAGTFLPTMFLIGGLFALVYSARVAVLCFGAWYFLTMFAKKKLTKNAGIDRPNALTTGELRDRVFAIAAKAGVQLRQVYVLPTTKIRMANAFAQVKKNVILTDYLLKNMSKREVDAVVGHEIGHLRLGHIGKRQTVYYVSLGLYLVLPGYLNSMLPERFPTGPVLFAAMLGVLHFVARKQEFEADAQAVILTGDPEAAITKLAKLSRLNTMPLHWGKASSSLLTHPTTLNRIMRVAKLGNVSAERISALLVEACAPPLETYELPASVSAEGKVFSTRFKSSNAQKIAWLMLFGNTVPAAVVAYVVAKSDLNDSLQWSIYGAGLAMCIGLMLWQSNRLPLWSHKLLERGIRDRLKRENAPAEAMAGILVGLAPHDTPRIYEGNWSWDMGLLSLQNDSLVYWGEEARFAIRREQISRIELGEGPANWWKTPSLYITWRDAEGIQRTFNLRAMNVSSMRDMAKTTRCLSRDLQNWQRHISPATIPVLAEQSVGADKITLPAPAFGAVTSVAYADAVSGKAVTKSYVITGVLAMGVAIVFGLHFLPSYRFDVTGNSGDFAMRPVSMHVGGWYVLFVAIATSTMRRWPARKTRVKRASSAGVTTNAPARASAAAQTTP
jgi:Zn-dependent protease with chaperone function